MTFDGRGTFATEKVPYEELDPSIVELVRVLNEEFDGLETIGSCGGHEDGVAGGIHAAADEWWVTFHLEPFDPDGETTRPSDAAWFDLEFLAYWIGRVRAVKETSVHIEPYAPPPQFNFPGQMLRFELAGYREEGSGTPDEVAAWILDGLREIYRREGPAREVPH